MDLRFFVNRDEFQDVQMELKRMQSLQSHHAERLTRLEKRQADDAALRSCWQSPFPSVLGGTPQNGPVNLPSNDVFDDLDEQSHSLLGSLHLGAVDDEPVRRGAASRANSVRFDESALHGAGWNGHPARPSGDFGPIRPSSGLGVHHMERSLSHKSDGRHSSTGHSVHSGLSGRASSLGLDTNFMIGGHEDDSPLDVPEPPPGFFFLGSAPAIVRCWVTTNFTSHSLIYAVVCSGSHKSTVDYSLIKELVLTDEIYRECDGVPRITLPVFLAEASVTQSNSRSLSPVPQPPSISASFEVVGMDQPEHGDGKRSIRVVVGSHALRLHSADLLFSQNIMTLYSTDRDKLSVPFVRPDDDSTFFHLTTANVTPQKPKLNATAPEFVLKERARKTPNARLVEDAKDSKPKSDDGDYQGLLSPTSQPSPNGKVTVESTPPESATEAQRRPTRPSITQGSSERGSSKAPDSSRREAIKTPWRQTASAIGDGGIRESTPLSGYRPASRSSRNMKVLKPNKSTMPSSSRVGAGKEPTATEPPQSRWGSDSRRKSQVESQNGTGILTSGAIRWVESKRTVSASSSMVGLSSGGENKRREEIKAGLRALRTVNNPLGSASAFSWISKPDKAKGSTTAPD